MLKFLFYSLTLLNALSFIVSFSKVRHSKKKIKFIYSWAFLYGAFVWEDLLVFSFYFFIASLISILLNDLRIFALLFIIFWLVRSAGETLYFFLQQFLRPKHSPHDIAVHIKTHHLLFGKISSQKSYILMQVFFQTILMFATAALIFLLINWKDLHWSL